MKNMFNIYYINYEKASEISMLFNNHVIETITKTKGNETGIEGEGDISTSKIAKLPVLNKIFPDFTINGNLSRSRSKQVEDTIKVVSTKSTILRPIYENATEVKKLSENKVGNLIKIKGVSLSVINLSDVLAIKTLLSGLIKKIPINDDSIDLTTVFPVLFKDSTYILGGKFKQKINEIEEFIIKIPMNSEAELESQYSISDLEIGDVTLLGIYRGLFDKQLILNKSNMMVLNNSESQEKNYDYSDIEDGVLSQRDVTSEQAHYIDVIAIIQELNLK